MVNKLLQKELFSYATPKSTWGIDLDSTDNNVDSVVDSEWTLVTTKNQRNQRKLTSEEDVWELKLDLDEMQELFTMSTHPYVKGLLLSLVNELQNRMKNMRFDLTEKLSAVKKWSKVVAGRRTCRKEESNGNLESNIISHSTKEPWITVNRGHKKPPSVNHAIYHQIPVTKNRYDLLSKRENYELMACETMGTHEPKVKNESRDMVQRTKNKCIEKKQNYSNW
jgi:hypothetical protein